MHSPEASPSRRCCRNQRRRRCRWRPPPRPTGALKPPAQRRDADQRKCSRRASPSLHCRGHWQHTHCRSRSTATPSGSTKRPPSAVSASAKYAFWAWSGDRIRGAWQKHGCQDRARRRCGCGFLPLQDAFRTKSRRQCEERTHYRSETHVNAPCHQLRSIGEGKKGERGEPGLPCVPCRFHRWNTTN